MSVPREALEAAKWLAFQAMKKRRFRLAHDILAGCLALEPGDRWAHAALRKAAIQLRR